VPRPQPGQPKIQIQFLAGAGVFSLPQTIRTGSGAHSASYTIENGLMSPEHYQG